MWLVFLLYALFASVFTVSKTALEYSEPFFLVGTRMFLAGLLMLLYQYFKGESLILKKSSWGKIVLLAIFAIYITNVFEFWGLKYLTSFKTCFIYSLSPFLSVLLSYLLFSETLTKKKWLGLLIGFAGFIPILLIQTTEEELAGHFWIFSWAELAVVAAVASAVYGWILLKQLVQDEGVSPICANGFSMLIGGLLALMQSLVFEEWDPVPVTTFVPFFECTLFLILVSNCICYNLYGFLLKRFSATFMSFAGLTTALFTATFGFVVHGEVTHPSFWLSFLVVLIGLVVFYQEELKKGSQFISASNTV